MVLSPHCSFSSPRARPRRYGGAVRYPDDVPRLTSPRTDRDAAVTLRAATLDDVPRIVEQCNDPASVEWTTVPVPYADSDATSWVTTGIAAGWESGRDLVLAIEHDGLFAGSLALRPHGKGEAEIGFGLHPDARGRGVMKTAVGLALDWAFTQQGVGIVHWRANVGNWASRRTAWSLGFTFGPTVPKLLDHRGVRVDAWTAWIGADDPREPTEPWRSAPVLETPAADGPALRLRPWADTDGPRLVEVANDERLRHFIPGSPLPTDLAAVPAYLTRVRLSVVTGQRLAWCVADPESDLALGNVALFDLDPASGTAELGFWAHPAARGRGVIGEAARTVADWALSAEGLGLRRLHLQTAASNSASRRVAEQAGFTHVGTLRKSAPTGDGFDDEAVYDRLA